MLESIRKHSKFVMILPFLLIIPSFILVGIDSNYFLAFSPVVARVDGKDITQDDWGTMPTGWKFIACVQKAVPAGCHG